MAYEDAWGYWREIILVRHSSVFQSVGFLQRFIQLIV
jgi:hypothetical protein